MAGRQSETALRERVFHDAWANTIDPGTVPVIESFTASTAPEASWLLREIGDLCGKRVLDLGSGAGEAAVYFARLGANVVASDLSPRMLEVVKKVAALHGTSVETAVCSAEDLSIFPADSFDQYFGHFLSERGEQMWPQTG
jgi:2-polyprenyl-3-methyl-5-hydroxy-6-metoxy-1,4-benzoquinol methylase